MKENLKSPSKQQSFHNFYKKNNTLLDTINQNQNDGLDIPIWSHGILTKHVSYRISLFLSFL